MIGECAGDARRVLDSDHAVKNRYRNEKKFCHRK